MTEEELAQYIENEGWEEEDGEDSESLTFGM